MKNYNSFNEVYLSGSPYFEIVDKYIVDHNTDIIKELNDYDKYNVLKEIIKIHWENLIPLLYTNIEFNRKDIMFLMLNYNDEEIVNFLRTLIRCDKHDFIIITNADGYQKDIIEYLTDIEQGKNYINKYLRSIENNWINNFSDLYVFINDIFNKFDRVETPMLFLKINKVNDKYSDIDIYRRKADFNI